MSKLPPARPGMSLAEIDTPALLIDLDAFERNLERMAQRLSSTAVGLRPHAKTHKSPLIARKQIEQGAVGVCCQKVSEAEVLVEGGVRDVLVSNEVVGQAKLERLAALARHARIAFCIDDVDAVAPAAAAAGRFGVCLDALVEIDVGAGRCGVAPGEPALLLADAIARTPGLRFAGLQAYHGTAQHIREYAERRAAIERVVALTRDTVERLETRGLRCERVTGGGTGTFEFEAASGVFTEVQAGSYVFMDADYARNLGADGAPERIFDHALFVCTTVMSVPGGGRAVVDAGHKTASVDAGMPVVVGLGEVSYGRPSDEHGVLDIARTNTPPRLGDKVLLIPGHCDPTVNLHDWYVCIRGLGTSEAHVEAVWPVAARGMHF